VNNDKFTEAEEKITNLMPRALRHFNEDDLGLGMAEVGQLFEIYSF